jgi:hypothetical protein
MKMATERTRIDAMKDLILAVLDTRDSSSSYTEATMAARVINAHTIPEVFQSAMGELVREFRITFQKHWNDSQDEPPIIQTLRSGYTPERNYTPPELILCPTAKVNLPPNHI